MTTDEQAVIEPIDGQGGELGTVTESMAVPTGPVLGSGRGRWLVALGVAGAALGLTVVVMVLLGAPQTPEALRYVPADAVVVAELRLDLPGDQLQKVGNLLAHFPGFADQSTLPLKLDEAGDRLLGALTNGEVSYTGDVKPWVGGPVFVAMRPIGGTGLTGPHPTGLFVATTDGTVGCATAFEGRPTTTETHRGVALQIVQAEEVACASDGRHVLIGDVASVRAGIDAHADGRGIDGDERYRTARGALGGEQLGTLYLRGAAFEELMREASGGAPIPGLAGLPEWTIAGVRAEDDALVMDAIAAPLTAPTAGPSLLSLSPAHASELSRAVPADALVYAEVQGASVAVLNALTLLRFDPTFAPALTELDQVLTAFGGAEHLLGWVDDAAIVVVDGGADAPSELVAGALLLARDDATAAARVATFRSLLGLASLGGGVELRTSTIAGVEVTTVVVTEDTGPPADEPLEVSFAIDGRMVLVGTGEGFIRRVLEMADDESLAADPGYQGAATRGLDGPLTTVFVDVGDAGAFAREHLPADARPSFDTEVQPYLSPIAAVHMSARHGADGSRARIVVIVSDPAQP